MRTRLSPQSVAGFSNRAGVGLKAEHYRTVIETVPDIGFFEVHAENYMGAGGPPHRYLTAVREKYPLTLHGVGLSIGADMPLDRTHLMRLKDLIGRYQPTLFSEHLAWSSHRTGYLNDLLPIPYTPQTLSRVADHIDDIQDTLGVPMLLENPSTYVAFAESTYGEVDFIAEVARRTGCGLLLDVNNVYISSINHQTNPFAYIEQFPLTQVRQMHLAGFANESDECGRPLLIDTHDRPVAAIVWDLYAHALARTGPIPTLIEWDADVPAWSTLHREAQRAERVMSTTVQQRDRSPETFEKVSA